MTAADRPYIASTWAHNKPLAWRGWSARRVSKRIDRELETARVVVYAAGSTVHAWVAIRDGAIVYAYVPAKLRGAGVARDVITHALGSYPERIETIYPWPHESERYTLAARPHVRTAA